MIRHVLVFAALASLAACMPLEESPPGPTRYPGVTVTGSVADVRGGPVADARVLIWNGFDTGSATTGADGTFSLVMDGSSETSSWQVTHAGYRPRGGSIAVGAAGADAGVFAVVSTEEIVFSGLGAAGFDLYMVRADGAAAVLPLTDTAGVDELTPRRDESGMTLSWADTASETVVSASWDGSGAATRWTAPVGYGLDAIAWCEVTTFVSRSELATGDLDIVMTANPGGFNYSWTPIGTDGSLDCSPPAFGYIGPQSIEGNMLAFAGAAGGLHTAFPYFTDSFLVPELIPGTSSGDWQPRWSPLFADGELWLTFIRNNEVWVTRVYASGNDNAWTTPVRIHGALPDDATAMRVAWAPETEGAPDRIAVAEHHLFSASALYEPGDIVVLTWDHATETFVGAELVYDASANGNVRARDLAWR